MRWRARGSHPTNAARFGSSVMTKAASSSLPAAPPRSRPRKTPAKAPIPATRLLWRAANSPPHKRRCKRVISTLKPKNSRCAAWPSITAAASRFTSAALLPPPPHRRTPRHKILEPDQRRDRRPRHHRERLFNWRLGALGRVKRQCLRLLAPARGRGKLHARRFRLKQHTAACGGRAPAQIQVRKASDELGI